MRRLIACWRLLRVLAHIGRGLAAVLSARAPDAARREAVVGAWSRRLLQILEIELQLEGRPLAGAKMIVANHVSWLDIAAIHAVVPEARFVAKADVKRWPLVGRLVDYAGTLYIERASKRDAMRVVHQAADALRGGATVAFFPEGTTGPGPELLPFHGNLLQAAIATAATLQPLALRWHEPGQRYSESARFIGDTTLVQSLWMVLCARGLAVRLQWLPPAPVGHADERRVLAERLRGELARTLSEDQHESGAGLAPCRPGS